MKTRLLLLLLGAVLVGRDAGAQDTSRVVGIRPPATVATHRFTDEASLQLFNGIQELKSGTAAYGLVRVLGLWGPHAGLDCGCLTQNLIIAFNVDGDDLSAFRLGPLLDPVVDSITTEITRPAVYITYGLPASLQSMRVTVLPDRLAVTALPRSR